ncbi:hypothetical protein [Alienimonas californiensis]|uniref:Cytochrome C n=1 Tax=Alienimonas californiensis TaxID=2527989 RepID=A0A517P6G4_9PLAN|nr:hypothetical protein [Alienimonas californiensis]QDT14966.1 hypothetical protein CA12_10460 [Alienimonas californiensis]
MPRSLHRSRLRAAATVGALGAVAAVALAARTPAPAAAPAPAPARDEVPKTAPQTLPAPVVDMHELMELFNEPLYKSLKKKVAEEPADARAWSGIKHDALAGAEIINLAAIREIGDEHKAAWPELTRTAQQAALDLAHAADAKDWQRTQAAWKSLVANCNDCHQKVAPDGAPMLKP